MKKLVYIGNDYQLETYYLKKGMVITEDSLKLLVVENKEIEKLFISTFDFAKERVNLENPNSFINIKSKEIMEKIQGGNQ